MVISRSLTIGRRSSHAIWVGRILAYIRGVEVETHLEESIDLVQMHRHVPHESVQSCGGIADEDLDRVHLDDGDGAAEENDGAKDEEQVPDSSIGWGSVDAGERASSADRTIVSAKED